MVRFINFIVAGIFSVSIIFINGGCEKFRDNREPITTIDNSLALQGISDVFKKVDEHARLKDGTVGKTAIDTCASVSITSTGGNFPKTMVIDYGLDNCEGLYGVRRRGKISALFSGPYKAPNNFILVSLDGYAFNDYLFQGDITITNKGGTNTIYEIKVENGIITTKEEEVITWNGTLLYEWAEGNNTLVYVFDDGYLVTGSGTGSNREGTNFDMSVSSALRVLQGCLWPVSGQLDIEPFDLKDREVDYGEGVCDNQADLTIGKRRDMEVTLR